MYAACPWALRAKKDGLLGSCVCQLHETMFVLLVTMLRLYFCPCFFAISYIIYLCLMLSFRRLTNVLILIFFIVFALVLPMSPFHYSWFSKFSNNFGLFSHLTFIAEEYQK